MKKKIVLLSVLVFVLTGCSSAYVLNTDNLDKTIEDILYNSNNIYNTNFEGYKYYVPKGMKYINKEEYNAIFRDRYNNMYYVYIDAVSYYHKVKSNYKTKSNLYLSKKLNYKNKFGYFEIKELKNGKYFIEAVYNYAKVEAVVKKNNLNSAVINICDMIGNVKYNRKVLTTLIGNKKLSYREEKFNISKKKNNDTNFLDYVNEYESEAKKDKKAKDEENLKIDTEE